MKDFFTEQELKSLEHEVLKLYFLIHQLAQDMKWEGAVSKEYMQEKIDRLMKGYPIMLHENLQAHMNKTIERWKK